MNKLYADTTGAALSALLAAVLSITAPHRGEAAGISQPAGYVAVDVAPGRARLACMAFEDSGDNTVGSVLGAQLKAGDRLLKWDALSQSYQCALKTESGWVDAETPEEASELTLALGQGFWIENRQQGWQVVFLSGRVPLKESQSVPIEPGLNLFGYPYPASLGLQETKLAEQGAEAAGSQDDSDVVSRVLPTGTYVQYWLMASEGGTPQWVNVESDPGGPQLNPAEGFWYQRRPPDGLMWTEQRRYAAEIFGDGAGYPRILEVRVTPEEGKVKLTLAAGTQNDTKVDIYRQHLNKGFRALDGWELAAADVAAGAIPVIWEDPEVAAVYPPEAQASEEDDSGPPRPQLADLGRVYVIATSEDKDADGLSDARELLLHRSDPNSSDTDADGLSDAEEVAQGRDPSAAEPTDPAPVLYVDAHTGNDSYSGLARLASGADGPKRTIRAALAVSQPGDIVEVASGTYTEVVNLCGKGVCVRMRGNVSIVQPE